MLAECDRRGITRREVTLHVGAGTFQPVKSEHIGDHPMHYEFISVPRDVIQDIINAPGPIIAVGTTSVRTLESLYYIGQILEENPDADEEALTVTQWMPYTTPCAISTQKALQNDRPWFPVPNRERHDHQLPPAPVHAATPRCRFCRQ